MIAIFATSVVVQGIYSAIKESSKRKDILSHLNDLTPDEEKTLKEYINGGDRSFKIDRTALSRSRIISRGLAEEKGTFAIFPQYVWKALKKKFRGKK
jgi:hypothetical protein